MLDIKYSKSFSQAQGSEQLKRQNQTINNNPLLYIISIFILLFTTIIVSAQTGHPLLDSFDEYMEMKHNSEFNLKWICLGPVMNSARVEAIQAIPGEPGIMYVAFGSGNLWKTSNNGLSWNPIFENQPVLGIGDIAIAPSDPNIIWLGSGESLKKARNFTMPGAGMFRSDDGGNTWQHKGLIDSYHIGEVVIDPVNPDKVLVAVQGHFWTTNVNRGIYLTEDGGENWKHVLYIDEKTGANDIVISPSNPDIIYASMWENNPGVSGKNSAVYKSKDGGQTWKIKNNGFPSGNGTGRIGLAVSYTDPDKVYALVDNRSKSRNKAAEVYKSTDGGESWMRTHKEELLIFPGLGWYFADIYVSPDNDEEIYALGVRLAYSCDGGGSFKNIGGTVTHLNPSPASQLHLDMCELWIDPEHPNRLLLGNDGGLYQSYDKGNSWLHHNNIPAGEFYDISVDKQDPYLVYGGVQDDASVYGPSKEWRPEFKDGWHYVWLDAWAGGDGCVTFADPEDPNTVYFSSQNGAARRKDMKLGKSISIRPRLPKDIKGKQKYAFITPYFISPHNSKTLYHAGNYVFKSTDRGDNWKLISPDLTDISDKDSLSTTAGALAESPLKPGLLYYGSDAGLFMTSMNDGDAWLQSQTDLPDEYIRSICPSNHSEARVYMAITGMNHDDFNTYLYVSEDYGANWRYISSNLPNEVANVILEDPLYENILYAGLYRGVYISLDRGESWSLFGSQLPSCSVSDLVIQNKANDLVIGTHGRGIYKMNLDPLHSWYSQGQPSDNILFEIADAKLPKRNDTHKDIDYSSIEKTVISFFLERETDILLELVKDDEVIWKHIYKGRKGFNQYLWDLVIKKSDKQAAYFFNYLNFPSPGNYKLRINGDDFRMETDMKIINQ